MSQPQPLPRPSTSHGHGPSLPSTVAAQTGTLRSLRQRFSLSRPLTASGTSSTPPSSGFHPLPVQRPMSPTSPGQQGYTQTLHPAPSPAPTPSPALSQASHLPSPPYIPTHAPPPTTLPKSHGHQKRRSFGLFGKSRRTPSTAGISSADVGRLFPDTGYAELGWVGPPPVGEVGQGRATIELARSEGAYPLVGQQQQGRNTLDIPREPVPTNGYPPGIGNMAYMHPHQQYDRPLSPAYLSPLPSPPHVHPLSASGPSATFFAPNIRAYSPNPSLAPSPSPAGGIHGLGLPQTLPPVYDRSPTPSAPYALPRTEREEEDPAITINRMRQDLEHMREMVESVAARTGSPLPFRASTPHKPSATPAAAAADPPPTSTPAAPRVAAGQQDGGEQLTNLVSDTTISSIATITPIPKKAPPPPLTLTLTPSSPSPARPTPGGPRRSNTDSSSVPSSSGRTRKSSTDAARAGMVGGEVLFQRAISPLAQQQQQQRSSIDSQRTTSSTHAPLPGTGRGRETPLLVSPGIRSVSSASAVTTGREGLQSPGLLNEQERRMPWRERIALRRERQAAERAELGVRSPSVAAVSVSAAESRRGEGGRSASAAGERRAAGPSRVEQRPAHSRQVSGASEYFSVRARSPDLLVEDLRPGSRGTPLVGEVEGEVEGEVDGEMEVEGEVEDPADDEESREIEQLERTARTADWLGSGPGRRALRAAGLLDDNAKDRLREKVPEQGREKERKESCPPTSGTRTARRGKHAPTSSQSTAATTRRRASGRSDAPSLSLPSRSVTGTPSLIVDSLTSTTTPSTATAPSSASAFSDPLNPPGFAQVLELHNLEKGALLGALRESNRREREREEECRRLGAELELLRGRIRELEGALARQQALQLQQQQQGGKKSRLPVAKQRVPSGASSIDTHSEVRPTSVMNRGMRRSDSASTLSGPRQAPQHMQQHIPLSPPSSGSGRSHSRSGSDSPTRVYRPPPPPSHHDEVHHDSDDEPNHNWIRATPRKHAASVERFVDSGSGSDSESLRLKTEDERHLQEFVDVTLGAGSDDESFY